MIIKRSFITIAILLFACSAFGQVEENIGPDSKQKEEKPAFSQRLLFGGELGLSFGSITYIKIAPLVGYRLTDRLAAGLGPIYIYEKYKYYNWETSIYGVKFFTSFTIIKGKSEGGVLGIGNIQFYAENEVINVEKYDMENERIWIDNVLIGGGLFQPLGERFGISFYVLWDVTQNIYSPYYSNNPVFRFGFAF
jgi:hypothetical protein